VIPDRSTGARSWLPHGADWLALLSLVLSLGFVPVILLTDGHLASLLLSVAAVLAGILARNSAWWWLGAVGIALGVLQLALFAVILLAALFLPSFV
jgi:hypothetical protein